MIREFIKNSTNVLIADIGTKTIGFIVLSLLTFVLKPNALGEYNALLTIVMSLYGMSGLGVAMVLQRESARHSVQNNQGLGKMIAAGMCCMVIAILLLGGLFYLFHKKLSVILFAGMDSQLVQWIPLLTLLYFLVQSPLSIILGMSLFKLYSYRNMLEALITGCFILMGGYFWGLEGVLYGLIISYGINSIVVWRIMKKSFGNQNIILSLKEFGFNALAILKKGIPYFIGNTFIGAIANIILIGLFSTQIGFEELGFLRLGLSMAFILMVIPNAAKTVTVTFLAKQETNESKLKSLQIRYLFFMVVSSTILMTLFLPLIVSIIYGNDYSKGVDIYAVILLINIFFSVQQILNSFMAGKGLLLFSGFVNGMVGLVYISLAILLIPNYGIYGYYAAFGGSYFLGLLIFLVYDFQLSQYPDKSIIGYFLIYTFVIIGLNLGYAFSFERTWQGDLFIWLTLIVYTISTFRFVFKTEEKELIIKLIRSIKLLN